MKWRCTIGAGLCLLAGSSMIQAEPATTAEPAVRPPEQGEMTRQWLDNQRHGRQASTKMQPLSGPVQEQVYERYRKSFSHPIPEHFERERIGTGGTPTR